MFLRTQFTAFYLWDLKKVDSYGKSNKKTNSNIDNKSELFFFIQWAFPPFLLDFVILVRFHQACFGFHRVLFVIVQ